MKTVFSQLSANRFQLFLLGVVVLLTGAVFIWFVPYLSGYDDTQLFAAHRYPVRLTIAMMFVIAIVTAAWLVTIRVFYKSQKILLIKNAAMKRTEEALQQSEARFRDLIENANDLIYTGDLQGNFTSLNKVGEIITGYSQAEFCRMNFAGVVAPEYLENVNRKFADKATSGVSTACELEIITKSGRRVALDLNNRIVFQAGEPIGVQGIGRDITARRRAEETLRESEARYRIVAESASDAIITIDREQTILFVNPAAEKIFGYAIDEMLGNKLFMLMPERFRDAHAAGMKRYGETKKRNISWQGAELFGLRKDGCEVPLEITFGEIRSGGKHLFTAVVRDITERKRTEEKLRESKEWLQAILDASRDGIVVEDGAEIVYINNSYTRLLGYDEPEELIGKQISKMLPPADAARMTEFGRRRLRGEQVPSVYEFKGKRKDGMLVEAEGSVSTAVIGGKKYIITASRDITERKRAEEELQKNLSLLTSTFEATADGILVVDRNNKIVAYNRHFVDMAQIPDEVIKSKDNDKVINFVLDQLADPEAFVEMTKQLVRQPENHSYDIIEFKDGRIFERYSHPQMLEGKAVGRVVSFRDITERKKAEKERDRFYTLSRDLIGTIGFDGYFKQINPMWEKTFGFSIAEMTRKKILELVHPDDRALTVREAARLANGETRSFEVRMLTRENSIRWFLWSSIPLVAERVSYAVGRDITERKRAEESLRESELRYRRLFESNPNPIWVHDVETMEFLAVNEKAILHYGYSREEFQKMLIKDLRPPEDLPNFFEDFAQANAGVEKFQSVRHRKKDGTIIEVEIAVQPINFAGRAARLTLITDVTERGRTERELQESQQLLKLVIDTLPQAIWWKDSELNFVGGNCLLAEIAGFDSPEQMIGLSDYDMPWTKEEADFYRQCDRRVIETGVAELNIIEPQKQLDGKQAWLNTNKAPLRNADGEIVGVLGTFADITEQRRADAALRESEYKFRTLLENMHEGLLQVDNDDDILFVNNRFCEMVGYSSDELVGTDWSRLVFDEDGHDFIKQVNKRRSEGISESYEICLRKKSNEKLWAIVGGAPTLDAEGEVTGSMGVFTDITARKSAEERLLHDALHDGLTGLANRALFTDHLQMTIERAKRDRSQLFAVLFLDFDRFKVINDSLGHTEGDNLLKQIAGRLESSLRSGDLVARLGGDEFTVLLNSLNDSSVALRVAERIQKNLQIPFELSGGEIFISASIGIALSTTGHERAGDMLRDADIAMYRAKAKGKARHQVFDQAMHEQAQAQLRIETEMRQAVEQKEFCLHYQPIFSLETNRVIGFESLVRWRHPEFGMISPDDFIPIAEENGLIIPLGQWILRESCRQMREWQIANPWASSLMVSVNLSFKQFLQLDLAEQVAATLAETRLDPKCLKLEITESHVMENSENAIVVMSRLRALGVELSLDDFGTGYSSLSYLHRLPVTYLKIDRSFVARMIDSGENGEIVHTIIKLAQNLKMRIIAEGVENAEQLNYLKNLNCEFGQGYYFSKPLEANAAARFIEDNGENQTHLSNQPITGAQPNYVNSERARR